MKQKLQMLGAALMLCATPLFAHDFTVGGIYYNITSAEDKTVEVTYSGDSFYAVENEYSGSIIIPKSVTYNGNTYSVTSIGASAFEDCSGLTSVVIPNSVTSIGDGAFYGTAWYKNQPDGVMYMDNYLLGYKGTMPSNTSIKIKAGTLLIANSAFADCSGLTSVVIPNSVTSIGAFAFLCCSDLTSVVIPNSVTNIGVQAFAGCSGLTSVEIPNSVTSIGGDGFL